jgi:hygromycin-B 4-O-kinase
VIRFVTTNIATTLSKDAYCAAKFRSAQVPSRASSARVSLAHYYAISERVAGVPSDKAPPDEYLKLIPAIIATAEAIHQIDVSDTRGYGLFSDTGVGMSSGWRFYLANIKEEEKESDFYGKWHALFDGPLLERDVWYELYERMATLLDFCPEDRWLLHGDYGFNNLLVDEGRITGVIDWADAKYGDFLADYASLIFFPHGIDFRQHLIAYYAAQGRVIPHLEERLRCYVLYGALDALRFFAKKGDAGGYGWVRGRIEEMGLRQA